MNLSQLYEEDFYAWTVETANLISAGKMNELDTGHLLEEMEGMSARERQQLKNRLAVLIMHLLKWQYQPTMQSRSWKLTITHQRQAITSLLEESPSLKSEHLIKPILEKSYKRAVGLALDETGFIHNPFPNKSPYTIEQILDDNFYPDNKEK
jgi:hypothetical protein